MVAFEPDVRLDELDRAVRARRHGLGGGAGEPVDHRAAGDEPEQERRVQSRELVDVLREPAVSMTMIEKIIVVAPTTAVPMRTGFAVALNVLPAPSFSSRLCLARAKFDVDAEVLLELRLDAGDLLDRRELVDRLRVVGHRAVGVDGDRHRSHAEEAERDEAEREDRRRDHADVAQAQRAHSVRDGHERHDRHADPVRAEIARHEARQDVEGGAALLGRRHHFLDVSRLGRREHLDEFRDDRAGQRAARDDGRELPPEASRRRPASG